MKKIFLYGYKDVCSKRYLDISKVYNYLLKNKYIIITKPQDADIIIIFTCAVSQFATDESIKVIKKFQNYNAELIVAGCLPAIEKEKLRQIFNGKVLVTKDLDQIEFLLPGNKTTFKEINDGNLLFQNINGNSPQGVMKKVFENTLFLKNTYFRLKEFILKEIFDEQSYQYAALTSKTFYYIRIVQGCLGNCSYCSIKKAIGSIVSKPIDQCIEEFKQGLIEGYKDFKIAGDDVGAYGLDIKKNFPELLDKMTKIPGDFQITIRSLHPRWAVKYINELEDILKRNKINHIGIPIQSASPRLLKLMHRYSDIEKVKDALLRLKKARPNLIIDTHYLFGFPSETYSEFKETLKFIIELGLAGFIIRWSPRPDTPAVIIEPKISEQETLKRLKHAKKILISNGYNVINFPRSNYFMFEKNEIKLENDAIKYIS